jgi:hypothetical protein
MGLQHGETDANSGLSLEKCRDKEEGRRQKEETALFSAFYLLPSAFQWLLLLLVVQPIVFCGGRDVIEVDVLVLCAPVLVRVVETADRAFFDGAACGASGPKLRLRGVGGAPPPESVRGAKPPGREAKPPGLGPPEPGGGPPGRGPEKPPGRAGPPGPRSSRGRASLTARGRPLNGCWLNRRIASSATLRSA